MGYTYVDLHKGKRTRPRSVVAKLPGTRAALAARATSIGVIASGILDAHSGRTSYRFHDLPSPTISVVPGRLDWYVMLNATADTPDAALNRAIGIEFGHRFVVNRSGEWGPSEGLGVLRRAVEISSLFDS